MNNRFKFRFWNKKNNAYVKSNKLIYNDGTYTQVGTKQMNNGLYHSYIVNEYNTFDIIPEQCTGLKDKNGKLIYEGDIIVKSDVSAIGYSRTRVCKVHWHNDWLSWAITTQYGDTYELSEFEPQQYEVIGNIHENADLLEINND